MGHRHPLLIILATGEIDPLYPSQRQDELDCTAPRSCTMALAAQHDSRLAMIRPSIRLDMKVRVMAEGLRDLISMIGLATVPIPDLLSLRDAAPEIQLTRIAPEGFVCGSTVPRPNLQRTIAQHSSQLHSDLV
jgi:hypothetical protein